VLAYRMNTVLFLQHFTPRCFTVVGFSTPSDCPCLGKKADLTEVKKQSGRGGGGGQPGLQAATCLCYHFPASF
jgi:hypothetical protein